MFKAILQMKTWYLQLPPSIPLYFFWVTPRWNPASWQSAISCTAARLSWHSVSKCMTSFLQTDEMRLILFSNSARFCHESPIIYIVVSLASLAYKLVVAIRMYRSISMRILAQHWSPVDDWPKFGLTRTSLNRDCDLDNLALWVCITLKLSIGTTCPAYIQLVIEIDRTFDRTSVRHSANATYDESPLILLACSLATVNKRYIPKVW